MSEALFDNSPAANRRKKTLKDQLHFQRVPIFDYEVLTKNIQNYRQLSATSETCRCPVCGKQFCPVGCTLWNTADPPDSSNNEKIHISQNQRQNHFSKSLRKNEARFSRSLEKIKTEHDYQISLINEWKEDKRAAASVAPELPKLSKGTTETEMQQHPPYKRYFRSEAQHSFTSGRSLRSEAQQPPTDGRSLKTEVQQPATNSRSLRTEVQQPATNSRSLRTEVQQLPTNSKSLRASTMFSLPLLATRLNNEDPLNEVEKNQLALQPNYPTPSRMGPKVWGKKKAEFDKLGSQLLYSYEMRKKREEEIPNLSQRCPHQKDLLVPQQNLLTQKIRLPSIKKKQTKRPADSKSKLKQKNLSNLRKPKTKTVGDLESRNKRIKFRSVISAISIPSKISSTSTYEGPDSLVEKPANSIKIQIDVVMSDNQPDHDMRKELISRQQADPTMRLFVDSDMICDECGALPCLNLRICPVIRDTRRSGFLLTITSFQYLFGTERIDSIKTKASRLARNRRLVSKMVLHAGASIFCDGSGKCRACMEDQLYSREESLYRRSLWRQCRTQALQLILARQPKKLV